jgi:hypothetical protein
MVDEKSDIGKRVRLISSSRPETSVTPGDIGTIWRVTQFGKIRVKWDDGSGGDLDPEKDEWEVLEDP